jgi:hypothetical protein
VLIRLAKILGAVFATGLLYIVLAINFGTAESRLVCPGQVQRKTDVGTVTTPATLYASVERYRALVFWFEHDAMIRWEVQPGGDNGFGYYDHSSFATSITDLEGQTTHGSFSSLSNRIYVLTAFDGNEAFDGVCD